ncbi:MAG TPA: hypothetical protein VFA89_11920 [Terriglobales bacterium]|nr:hypothetical protein [Terriglobales bacterium]
MATVPSQFRPHPNLSDTVNRHIVQSEIEGGVSLQDLPPETTLLILTQHSCYTVTLQGEGQVLISGHPQFCPEPVLVTLEGSTWGGSMLKSRYIGRGMHLEFRHPRYPVPIVTSRIEEIQPLGGIPHGGQDRRAHHTAPTQC